MDGCLTAVGHVPVLEQVLPRLQKLQRSVDDIITDLQAVPAASDDAFRTRVLSSLKALREPPDQRVVQMPEMMADVVRELGVADPSRHAAVAAVATSARSQAGAHLHLGERNRDELSRRAGAQRCLRTLEHFLDAVDSAFTPKLTGMRSFLDRANAGEVFTGDDCKNLAGLLANDDALRHFFLGLTRTECVPALMKAKLLAPRSPTASTKEGLAIDPRWWAGEYLVKIAETDPKLAVDAILDQAPESISQSVASAIRRASAKLPAEQYRRLHSRILLDLEA